MYMDKSDWILVDFFKPEEFACTCCGEVKISMKLVRILDKARGKAGFPFAVSSGYRCPEYNALIGGGPEHELGLAADIVARQSRTRYHVLFSVWEVHPINRIGVDKTFIHFGVGTIDDGLDENVLWPY